MSLYKKYSNLLGSVVGQMLMGDVLPSLQDAPTGISTGSIFLTQDTNSLYIYNGSAWELLSQQDYVDITIPPKYTKEELDYINNIKPFLSYVKGEDTKDTTDLIRKILIGNRRSESSRFLLFS